MINPNLFFNCLIENGLEFFTGVPDSLLKHFCSCLTEQCDPTHHIIAANEGNAVSIAAGYHLSSGKCGVVYMQNSGEGNAVNPLVSLVDKDVYQIPMLLMIGWRGEPGIPDEPQHVKQGKITLTLLEALGIEYKILDDNYKEQIFTCKEYMDRTSQPIALIIKKNAFDPYPAIESQAPFSMTREDVLEIICNELGDDSFIVSTTGFCSRELFEIRERQQQDHDHDFLTVGSMGHTSSIAMGMALGTSKQVYCIDGDGSFLMHMGSAAVTAQFSPDNFHYIMIDNGVHDSVGGQPTVGLKIDAEAILQGCGFRVVYSAKTQDELISSFSELKKNSHSALIVYCNPGARNNLGRPTTTPRENKNRIMAMLSAQIDS